MTAPCKSFRVYDLRVSKIAIKILDSAEPGALRVEGELYPMPVSGDRIIDDTGISYTVTASGSMFPRKFWACLSKDAACQT